MFSSDQVFAILFFLYSRFLVYAESPSEAVVQRRGQHCPQYPFDFPAELVPYMDRRISRELQADMKASEVKGHSASQWLKGTIVSHV